MATPAALEALIKTEDGLKEIKKRLGPFLHLLTSSTAAATSTAADGRNVAAPSLHVRAQAQAVVALSVGTLRYIGARLRGLDQGRKPDDPLRQDLNHMRKVLVEVENLNKPKTNDTEETEPKNAPVKEATDSDEKDNVATEPITTKDDTIASITIEQRSTIPTSTVDAVINETSALPGSGVDKTVAQRLVKAALNTDADSPMRQEAKPQAKRGRDTSSTISRPSRGKSKDDNKTSKTSAKKQRKSR